MKITNQTLRTNAITKSLLRQIPALTAGLIALFVVQPAGATSYTWNVTSGNWSTTNNWSPNTVPGLGGPLPTDSVTFGNTGAVGSPTTVNNTVDLGFDGTVTNLTYNSVASGTYVYDVSQIPSGQTLTVRSNVLVGGLNEGAGAFATFAYMYGPGTFLVTGPSFTVQNYGSASGANACAYLNLSGLTNFIYNNPSGTISIENNPGSLTRLGGSMFLAAVSNSITAASINLGTSTSAQAGPSGSIASGVAALLTLGSGTNIINASTINIANQKSAFTVTNSGGGLRIRGVTGASSDSAVNITLGNRNVGGGSGNTIGNLLLNGCAVDIKAGTLIVGENSGGTPNASGDNGVGLLQFDTGTISANTVIMADNTSGNQPALASCTGTIDVGANATLLIGAGQLFDLASETSTGPSTGTLIISNGLVNCQGPIAMGPSVGNACNGSIVFLTGGTLNMGPNSYVGVVTNPITALTLTNNVLSVSIPSVSYTNICVQTLNWPTPDSGLNISIAAMPAGINPGAVFPFLNFTTMNGTFNDPQLTLPPGVQGNLSLAPGGNTIYLTITGGVGPGTGGVNQLLNPSFEQLPPGTGWATVGGTSVITTNSSTTYPNSSGCNPDTRPIQVLTGTNSAKMTGSFVGGGSTNSWSQSIAVAAGSTLTAGAFTYVAHEDMLSGKDSFYYEVDFKDTNGILLASYESTIVTNLSCSGPNVIPLDTWALMAVTNVMQVSGGINTAVVLSNIASIITAPPQTATAQFKAIFVQRNGTDTGSVYFDAANLGLLAGPVPPTISAVSPNLVTLCTNTVLTCVATSTVTSISSVQLIVKTTTLGGSVTNITTNTVGSTGLTVTGIGTSSANISLALATNTIYQSVIVTATDADGISVSTPAVTFDTLTPTLVIEASDFNYSGGQFIDTPANGGLALYVGQVGSQGIDENKVGRTGEAQSYYRPSDAVIMQAAAPGSGTPPTGTEQKFVTAAANGDTTDIEVEVGYNSAGDWLNYTRTFGSGGSAPAGTYNVWCYLATSGSGLESTFSELTSDPTQANQTTNFLGDFGTAAFSDASYNSFVYVPLVDQFGNRVAVTVTNGQQTFKATVVGNPNIGMYIFVPVAPIYTPVFENIYPNGPSEPTGQFTFTVGPAQGASISTNGIGVILNGVTLTSGLSFISAGGGSWTVNYPIQSNALYTVVVNVTNTSGLTATYSSSFDTFNLNNYHWMAVDYDFSTNNGTGSGGSVGDGWTGGLFIDNPVPTGDTAAPAAQGFQLVTNSYFGYPTGFTPANDPTGSGAVAQQSIDIYWPTNANQDTVGGQVGNSVYRGGPYTTTAAYSDGVGNQVAGDSFVLPEFTAARTNLADPLICEFNIGYFYATNWLNYTRTYPTNTYNIWGRLAAGTAFSGATLSAVTSGVGTSNQTTSVLGTFSDANPAGYQVYHWIPLLDASGNPVVAALGGVATLRLTAPTNATPNGGALNPLFFMLVPATAPATPFAISASVNAGNIQISIPTQLGHNYTLWYANSLPGSSWTQVGGNIAGNGSVQVITQSLAGNQGYYRVVAH